MQGLVLADVSQFSQLPNADPEFGAALSVTIAPVVN